MQPSALLYRHHSKTEGDGKVSVRVDFDLPGLNGFRGGGGGGAGGPHAKSNIDANDPALLVEGRGIALSEESCVL